MPTGGVQVASAPVGHVGSSVMFAGQLITGAVLSMTVTVWLAVPVLPFASVTE